MHGSCKLLHELGIIGCRVVLKYGVVLYGIWWGGLGFVAQGGVSRQTGACIVAETEDHWRVRFCGVEMQQEAPVIYHGIWDANAADLDVEIL
jgi:hypothetical protein